MTISPQPKFFLLVTSVAMDTFVLARQNHLRHAPRDDLDPPFVPFRPGRSAVALPDRDCQIAWPRPPPPDIQITYAASAPGCGSLTKWNLVEALTGLETGDDWNNNGRGDRVVAVSTHYPHSNGVLPPFDQRITRAFLVLRNPMQSIPSFFDDVFETINHFPVHGERDPMAEWITWRDHFLEDGMREYEKFIMYWMDRYTPENRYVISYEDLTDDLNGPEVTKGLNEFLGQAEGVEASDPESVPCIWKAVVKNQSQENEKEQAENWETSKAGGDMESRPSMGMGMSANMGIVPNVAFPPPPPRLDMNPYNDRFFDNELQQPDLGGPLDMMHSEASSRPVPLPPDQAWPGADKYSQAMYLDQTQQQVLQRPPQLQTMPAAPLGSETFAERMYPPAPDHKQVQHRLQPMLPFQQQPEHIQRVQRQPPQIQPYGQYPHMQQYQQLMPPMQYQRPMNIMPYDYPSPGNLRRRHLDPDNNDSQPDGSDVPRPYTVKQLELMMRMLSNLSERYRDDVTLSNIMSGYVEEVGKARNELAASQGLPVALVEGFV
ncbi:hypothetical protein ACHAW6_001834 [Cyclotella cf. meneghiniana]